MGNIFGRALSPVDVERGSAVGETTEMLMSALEEIDDVESVVTNASFI